MSKDAVNTILETQRLSLREFLPGDAEALYKLNLDPEVIKYTGNKAFENVAEAEEFLRSYDHYHLYGFGRWAVVEKNTGEFLGWCGLKFSPEKKEHDIGFRFFKTVWNKGYASESAKACLDAGFNKFKMTSIVGRAMKENIASVRVLEKIGMNYHRDFDFDGQPGLIYKIEK